jgi:hypothetical protein
LVRDSRTAEAIISQAIELARNAKADNVYPEDELNWLTGKTIDHCSVRL